MLIACHHTVDEIAAIIGADSLGYLKAERLGGLIDRPSGKGYCDACFTANYRTEIPQDQGKRRFEMKLSEKEKKQ